MACDSAGAASAAGPASNEAPRIVSCDAASNDTAKIASSGAAASTASGVDVEPGRSVTSRIAAAPTPAAKANQPRAGARDTGARSAASSRLSCAASPPSASTERNTSACAAEAAMRSSGVPSSSG
jgi:hypothetical protein